MARTHPQQQRALKTLIYTTKATCASSTKQPGLPGTSGTWQERNHLENTVRKCFFCCCFLQGEVLSAGKHGQEKERGPSWKPPAPSAGLGAERRLFGQGDPAVPNSCLPAAPRTSRPPRADPICWRFISSLLFKT